MRMFAPTFLFAVICRFMPGCSWCPDGIVRIAENCPSFLTGDFGLCVFGVLGLLEIAANWDDTLRELISESNFDTYVKPVFAALITYSILTPEQIQVVSSVMDSAAVPVPPDAVADAVEAAASGTPPVVARESGSAFAAVVCSLLNCGGTYALCRLRARVVETVREMDPDDSLHLNTLLTAFEEGSWLVTLPLLLVFPILALILLALFALGAWSLSRPLARLTEKRLAYWNAIGMDGVLKRVRVRAIAIFAAGALLTSIPVVGYLATVIALNLFVFGVISLYEKRSSRIFARIVMRFVKLTILLFAIVFSGVPFLGVVFLIPHFISYCIRMNRLKKCIRLKCSSVVSCEAGSGEK